MRKEAEAAGEVIAWLDAASQREDAATAQDRAPSKASPLILSNAFRPMFGYIPERFVWTDSFL